MQETWKTLIEKLVDFRYRKEKVVVYGNFGDRKYYVITRPNIITKRLTKANKQ